MTQALRGRVQLPALKWLPRLSWDEAVLVPQPSVRPALGPTVYSSIIQSLAFQMRKVKQASQDPRQDGGNWGFLTCLLLQCGGPQARDSPGREGHWQVALCQSGRTFWINSPPLCQNLGTQKAPQQDWVGEAGSSLTVTMAAFRAPRLGISRGWGQSGILCRQEPDNS